MITIQVESFVESLEELKTLLPSHYDELALNKDKVPLDPIWPIYVHKETVNELLFMTARKDGAMIGYFIGFVCPSLHYRTCFECMTDIFFVSPEHRKSGIGWDLFVEVEKELKRRGVQRWFVDEKIHAGSGANALFKKASFEPVETKHCKWIGG